jgi:hypothetical protein
MTHLNYFALSAALGASIGPRSQVTRSPSSYREMTREMADLMSKRRPHVQVLHEPGCAGAQYIKRVCKAFMAVRDGYSPDRVVADPHMNREFLKLCEAFGLEDEAFNLNWTLLNLRKAGELSNLQSRKSIVADQWHYIYASEIAARSMFYRHNVSVDKLICHPKLVREFDKLAKLLAPGFSVFQYRWAALNVRKKGAFRAGQPDDLPKTVEWSHKLKFNAVRKVPKVTGVYTLHEDDVALYIASSEDLHESIGEQRRLAGVQLVEAGLWQPRPERLYWKYAALPDVSSSTRYGLVNRLVSTFAPVFNIPRHRAAA